MNWKAKPTGKHWVNKSLELQLLLSCNWNCHACDQFSNLPQIQWVRKATMSMAQIAHFVAEMQLHNAYIGRIRLMGGEATLHPKFAAICEMLQAELVETGHVHQLECITNGSHRDVTDLVKHFVRIRVSGQGDKEKHHVANLVHTPAELGYEGKICSAPWHCGISLNYYGYFPCSAGAGIARLRDDMAPYQRLDLPLKGVAEWENLQNLCNHCYHGLRPEHKIKCGTAAYELNAPSQDTWKHLGAWVHGKRPTWKAYGA